ncbi:glycosyltransferase family 4 protein [Azorhizobium doebereinerae]|uniref:glycosyltransferase family 4 protein n=1 Tax=Azorhizobium doebereinerae TaxID=281091 RepID=UPI000411EE3A|nr:glycosyltransferase family 4 protein [Azorhizobium doebereinerae]
MRIAILWTGWSGYMDACARALQAFTGCELDIVCFAGAADAPFRAERFFRYPCRVLALDALRAGLPETRYDLAIICGWHVPAYREIAAALAGRTPRVLCMDNQWRGTARQYLGIAAFRARWHRLFDHAFVPGPRQAAFAVRLGFPVTRVIEGHLSADTAAFTPQAEETTRARTMLFAGRLAPEKGLDTLAQAWRGFCGDRRHESWRLKLCGAGAEETLVRALPQAELSGFVQPADLPGVMRTCAALVLPSRREPWGIVVHEAAAAGLPLILTDRCGAADTFLRDGLNGYRVPAEAPDALQAALERFAALEPEDRRAMAARSVDLSRQRSPLTWAAAVTRALA